MVSNGLSDEVNSNIVQSEIDGGIYVADIKVGMKLHIQTQNTLYTLENVDGNLLISGHRQFCPTPTECNIAGSTWGGSMLKSGFIGRGMRLEFVTNKWGVIITSIIKTIDEVKG